MRRFRRSAARGRREFLKVLAAGWVAAALCAAGTMVVAPGQAPDARSDVEAALAGRRDGEGMEVVRQLCSAACAGRKAGTPGAARAADWLAGEFRRLGLALVPGAPAYRQRFTMPVSLLASRWDQKAKLTGPDGRTTALIEYPCFRGNGFSAEAEAVFAGWGISRRDQGWDDYHGRDVKGKYVVYWEGAPGPGLDREENARWRDAQARGARGCLVLSRGSDAAPTGLESPVRDFPVLRLDPLTARRVLNAPVPPPGSRPRRALAPLRIDIPRADDPARPVANIIGMIPGADPALAGEAVILSAHYDHLGASPSGGSTVYPGADDDASGVAVVLGAARALRAAGARPRRSILFCLWTGEECGLVGSRAYVEHPLVPLERTRFALQVEMVGAGRPDTFETSAARLAGTGHAALSAAATQLGLTLAADDCKGISDHLPFIRRGVPALVVTTVGEHPNYHTPRDTPERLQPAGIENATRLCALAVWKEANGSDDRG